MPSHRRGGRVSARARRSIAAASAVLVAACLGLVLPPAAHRAHAYVSPCAGFDCDRANSSDTSGSPGRTGDFLIWVGQQPVIAFCDSASGDLRLARRTPGAGWTLETLDAIGDVGAGTSMAVDDFGQLMISYYDATQHDLKLAHSVAGGWSLERVDTTGDV